MGVCAAGLAEGSCAMEVWLAWALVGVAALTCNEPTKNAVTASKQVRTADLFAFLGKKRCCISTPSVESKLAENHACGNSFKLQIHSAKRAQGINPWTLSHGP